MSLTVDLRLLSPEQCSNVFARLGAGATHDEMLAEVERMRQERLREAYEHALASTFAGGSHG